MALVKQLADADTTAWPWYESEDHQIPSTLTGNRSYQMISGVLPPSQRGRLRVFRSGGSLSAHTVVLKNSAGATLVTFASATAGYCLFDYDNSTGTFRVVGFSGVTVA